ncbi:HAD-IIB family hydrolase [Thiomicrorhabdus arctica]|uniref:HAD-IIB family hydrolase n=1 Tax=Thiomicrorhabdus arctica TaxID=131540 RepID=UPI00037DF354|nr:HAD-IIB family hydrolase [Thiomicrorhabdus arctica]
MSNLRKLLFTDLDGSLLDHHNYDYSAALPAINALKAQAIPWILSTSKTAAEVIELRAELDNHYPFIVENGAGIFWEEGSVSPQYLPKNSFVQSWGEGFEYISLNQVSMHDMLQLASFYKEQFKLNFIGFSEMSIQQVAECTGLSWVKAAKAKQRQFSEPLLWQDSEENLLKFQQALKLHGLQLIKGGRFMHLMGLSSKGMALQWLAQYYHQAWSQPIQTMALGDGDNDIPLLEASDCPVIIRSPVNALPKVNHPNVLLTQENGPSGWNQAVLNWLERT